MTDKVYYAKMKKIRVNEKKRVNRLILYINFEIFGIKPNIHYDFKIRRFQSIDSNILSLYIHMYIKHV